jgi:hypothetical protein
MMEQAGMTDSDDDQPYSMQDAGVRERRRAMLDDPHMRDLTRFAKELRLCRPEWKVPDFDPLDGGVKAQALFLLDTPGSEAKNSGFVSCNNPDDTAKYMRASWREAGLKRCRVLLWNVVPHCLENDSTKKQVREAIQNTQAFIDKLPDLKVVVFCGEKAWSAKKYLTLSPSVVALLPAIQEDRPIITTSETYTIHSEQRRGYWNY